MVIIRQIEVLVALLIGAMCVYLMWRSVRAPRGFAARPACGACGQEVALPLPERCPECGRLTLEAGVVTGGLLLRQRGNALIAVASWSLLVFMAYLSFGEPMVRSWIRASGGGPQWKMTRTLTFTPQPSAIVDPTRNYTVAATLVTIGMPGLAPMSGTVKVTLTRGQAATPDALLDVDLASPTWRVTKADGSDAGHAATNVGRGGDAAIAVAKLYAAAGLDATQPKFDKEAAHVAQMLMDATTQPQMAGLMPPNQWASKPGGFTMMPGPSTQVMVSMASFMGYSGQDAETAIRVVSGSATLAIWVGGAAWCVLRRRSELKRVDATPA